MFQEPNRLSRNMKERKFFKVELIVPQNGAGVTCKKHYLMSVSGMNIMRKSNESHKHRLKNNRSDRKFVDDGQLLVYED